MMKQILIIKIFLQLLIASINGKDFQQRDKYKRDVFISGDAGEGYRYVHDIPPRMHYTKPRHRSNIGRTRPKFGEAQVVSYHSDDQGFHANIQYQKEHSRRKSPYIVSSQYRKTVSTHPQSQAFRLTLPRTAHPASSSHQHLPYREPPQHIPRKITHFRSTQSPALIRSHSLQHNAGHPSHLYQSPSPLHLQYPQQSFQVTSPSPLQNYPTAHSYSTTAQPIYQSTQYVNSPSALPFRQTPSPGPNQHALLSHLSSLQTNQYQPPYNPPQQNYPIPYTPQPHAQYYPTPQPFLPNHSPSPYPQLPQSPTPPLYQSTISPHYPNVTAVYRSTTGLTPRPAKPTEQPHFHPNMLATMKSLRFHDEPVQRYRSTIGPYKPLKSSIKIEKELPNTHTQESDDIDIRRAIRI